MSAESDALVAAWDGQPAADLHADITEIIGKVGIGAENPNELAEEIAYVVMQHGMPVAAVDRIQTVRALVDCQTKACALTHDREQFAHNWQVLHGIDLALLAIRSPQIPEVPAP